ncbi:MAG: aldose 1-epimerase family protein [Chitinophagales bacterium]
MFSLENEFLHIMIDQQGAELQSVYGKLHQLEWLWDGNPAFWAKRSPVLFPIVGTLRENKYYFNGKAYSMNRHGFAREKSFIPDQKGPESISFSLREDESTLQVYPFAFEFSINYTLDANSLHTLYRIVNRGQGDMYFSVGGHPAFKIPLVEGTSYDDYFLEFNEDETKPRWPISAEGLIEKKPIPLLVSTDHLPLTKDLFKKDAVVLKFPTSSIVSLRSEKTPHGLDFNFSGFPYLGLWAAHNADFLCIEPWCGIADPVDSDQQLVSKEGINRLPPGNVFERKWTASFF